MAERQNDADRRAPGAEGQGQGGGGGGTNVLNPQQDPQVRLALQKRMAQRKDEGAKPPM